MAVLLGNCSKSFTVIWYLSIYLSMKHMRTQLKCKLINSDAKLIILQTEFLQPFLQTQGVLGFLLLYTNAQSQIKMFFTKVKLFLSSQNVTPVAGCNLYQYFLSLKQLASTASWNCLTIPAKSWLWNWDLGIGIHVYACHVLQTTVLGANMASILLPPFVCSY